MPKREMTELTATEGDFVVRQLITDVLLTDHVVRSCFETAAMNDLDKKTLIGFIHYVIARPVGMSKCSQTDLNHILGTLLDVLMITAPELDHAEMTNAIPLIYGLLSADDPETIHIRTSTLYFLQVMKNGGNKLTDDDSKLLLMFDVVESLQVEVPIFLNWVLKQYVLDWTRPGEVTEAKRHQAEDIADLRKMVREEADRFQEA